MKQLITLVVLLFAATLSLQAQSQKACCAGKDKAACTKEASAKAACCAKKADGKSCAKAEAKTVALPEGSYVEASIRIYGNCGMCKRTIEGALKDVEGIKQASWDVSTGMLTVAYEEGSVTEEDIKKKVAAVGYDSDTHRAPDEVYSSLHACCQYERPKG